MEKMREEFEAWYEGHCAPLESDWFKRDSDFPDDYEYFPAQEAWAGWQASRAAICVELPEVRVLNGGRIAEIGYEMAVDDFESVLDAAGIRYT